MNEPPKTVDLEIGGDDPANIAESAAKDPAIRAIAVALGQSEKDPSKPPRVLATGRGEFAQVILDIAFKHDVKVREDSDLAEILAAVDLDSDIPVEAFIAVAEILRYVYANNNQDSSPENAPSD
ncbi:MAG: EscU/YscU/HrcU family type III secretion system export apparatus switch protein [Alphaproteobacteria bacterium]|nr:EscU/YscU/HrcU family type III secretion system export apparatus switch protein [Alphaproteobacteria bacterium]